MHKMNFDYMKYQLELFLKFEHIVAHLPKKYQWELLDVLEAVVFGGAHLSTDYFKQLESDIADGTILYHK